MRRLIVLLFIALLLASCRPAATATTPSTTPVTTTNVPVATTTTTMTPTTTTLDDNVDIPRIKVEDGVKTEGLDTISVRVGERVRFEVETDVADEIHVHGFDLTFETVPNQEIVVDFIADATGIFEVELEGAGIHLVDIEVTP